MIQYLKINNKLRVEFPETLPALKLFQYLANFGSVSEFVGTALKDNRLVLPSLFSESPAICFASALGHLSNKLGVYNYLFFRDEEKVFCVIQHHSFISLIFFIDLADVEAITKLRSKKEAVFAITNQSIFINYAEELSEEFIGLIRNLNRKCVRSGKVCEFIDGYQRPYHYFYDRLPWLIEFSSLYKVDRVESFPASRFIDLEGASYYESELERYRIRYEEISIIPGRVGKVADRRRLAHAVISAVDSLLVKPDLERLDLILWIGLCEEKRPWPEKAKAITEFIAKLNAIGIRYHIYFDGLTRPTNINYEDFLKLEICTKDNQVLDEILQSVVVRSFSSLVGCTAIEKLSAASSVDFFFTNGLTDSMWCAHFYRKPGLAYLSVPGTAFQHSHPKTSFIDEKNIDPLEETGNWARIGSTIDPYYVSDLLLKDILVTIELKEKLVLRDVLKRKEVGSGLAVLNEGSDFKNLKITLRGTKKYLPLDGEFCGFGFSTKAISIETASVYMCLDAEVHGDASVQLYAIFYSSEGERLERFSVNPGGEGRNFQISSRSKFVRLFYRFSGEGEILISGFRFAPC